MALTPKTQLRRIAVGTSGSLVSLLLLILTSEKVNPWLFYGFSLSLLGWVAYAIPGYIGIWVWRMRKFLFDMD